MDIKTAQTLQLFRAHSRIKNFLTYFCYFLIVSGLFVYIFYAFNSSRAAKLVLKYKENADEMKTEKIMTNPRIDFQYNDGEIYHIKAKRAFHRDNQRGIMYDVSANGKLGKIDAGELQIDEAGDRLIFTKNPVLILNKTDVKK
jgi:hypothetical protein